MADNGAGGNHVANGSNHVANGGDHAACVAAANGAAENGGDPEPAPAAAAANGVVANGANRALVPAAAAANGNAAHAPAAAAPNGNAAHAVAAAAVHGAAMGYGGAMAPALRLIPEAVLDHVVLRMPAAMVARFRVTNKRWRDLTRARDFRLAHYACRSLRPMPLFSYTIDHLGVHSDDEAVNDPVVRVHLRAIETSRRESFKVMRFSHFDPALLMVDPSAFRVHGSCDGILLLSYRDSLYACNPCTHRWARLPPLHSLGEIVGFYTGFYVDGCLGHGMVKEYRVLYHHGQHEDRSYCVFPFGSPELQQEARDIGRQADMEAVRLVLACGISPSCETPPVTAGRCLYWLSQPCQNNSYVLELDTQNERFRWIHPPVVAEEQDGRLRQVDGHQLLEINGRLAMTLVSPRFVEVWVLHYGPYNLGDFSVWSYRLNCRRLQSPITKDMFALATKMHCPQSQMCSSCRRVEMC